MSDRRLAELDLRQCWEQEQRWLIDDPAYELFLAELEMTDEDRTNDGLEIPEERGRGPAKTSNCKGLFTAERRPRRFARDEVDHELYRADQADGDEFDKLAIGGSGAGQ